MTVFIFKYSLNVNILAYSGKYIFVYKNTNVIFYWIHVMEAAVAFIAFKAYETLTT